MNTLLIGPLPPPATGQAVAFELFSKNTSLNKHIININYEGAGIAKKIEGSFHVLLKFLWVIIFNKIDCVYITTSRTFLSSLKDILIIFFSRLFKIRIVNHLHGADFLLFRKNIPSWYRYFVDSAYKLIDQSIVLSDGMKEQYACYPDMKLSIVKNCYDPSIIDTKSYSKVNNGTLKILFLSNLMASKGIYELVTAVREARNNNLDVELNVAGRYLNDDVMSASELSNKLADLWDEGINYVGVVSGEEKNKLLQKSDVLALPTYYKTEAQPICILEGMASGSYILTTDHNYIGDIISCENGAIVEPKSIESILCVIKNIFDDSKNLQKVKQYNSEYAIKNFNIDKYVKNIEGVIVSAVSNVTVQ